MRADIELVPTRALASAAMALSLELDHPAYDCMYFALAVDRAMRSSRMTAGLSVSSRNGERLICRAGRLN